MGVWNIYIISFRNLAYTCLIRRVHLIVFTANATDRQTSAIFVFWLPRKPEAVIVSFTAILVAYLTKQFQNENLNYLKTNPMKNSNKKVKTIEKEKVVAETLNGRFAMLGLIAALGAYLTTGQIIPGFV